MTRCMNSERMFFFSWRPWSEWLVVYDELGRIVGRRVRLALVRLAPWLSVDAVISIGTVRHPGAYKDNPGPGTLVYDHTFVGHACARRVISSSEDVEDPIDAAAYAIAPLPSAQGGGVRRRGIIAIGAFFTGSSGDVSEMLNSVDGSVTRAQLAAVAEGHGVAGALASDGLMVTYSDLSEAGYADPAGLIPVPGTRKQD